VTELQIYMAIGLGLFFIAIAALAFQAYKKTTTMADFAIAGAKMGPVTLGLAFAATFFSAATFVGYTGWAYEWGLSTLWIFLTLILASPMGLILVAKRARAMNVAQGSLSLPDWLGDRYGSDFVRVAVALITLFNLFYIAAQFSAGALVFNQLLDVPYTVGLIIIAVIVIAYTYGGGSFADIYTDAFQALLMLVMGVLVFISGLWVFDAGPSGVMRTVTSTLSEQDPNMVATVNPDSGVFYSVGAIIGAFIIQFAFAAQPQLFNKVLALEKPQDMAKMIATYVVAAVCFLVVIFGGLYAAATVPDLESADNAIFEYALVAFPVAVVAILGVVVMAAAMSTSDGIFVVISTSIANDIYAKFLVPRGLVKTPAEKVDRTALKISRAVTLLTGIAATLLVIEPPAFIGTFIWIGISGVAAGTLGPLLIGLFLPRLANANAAKVSVVGGLASYLVILLIDFEKSVLAAGAWAVLMGVAIMLVASLLLGRTGDEKLVDADRPA
jgi:sodium/pantothenate symporter